MSFSLASAFLELPETNALVVNPLKVKPILAIGVKAHQKRGCDENETKRLIRQGTARASGSYTENTDPRSSTAGPFRDAPGYRLLVAGWGIPFTFTMNKEIVVNITRSLPVSIMHRSLTFLKAVGSPELSLPKHGPDSLQNLISIISRHLGPMGARGGVTRGLSDENFRSNHYLIKTRKPRRLLAPSRSAPSCLRKAGVPREIMAC